MKHVFYFGMVIIGAWSIIACEEIPVVFEGDSRHNAVGELVDRSGQPIPDVWVQVLACKRAGNCSLAGYGKTNKKGSFNFIHSGSDAKYYVLKINSRVSITNIFEPNNNYKNKSFEFSIADYKNYFKDWGIIEI